MLDNIWKEFLKIANEEIGSRVVDTWFKSINFYSWDPTVKVVILSVPNSFIKSWIEKQYINIIKLQLCRLLNENDLEIKFIDNTSKSIDNTNDILLKPALSFNNPSVKNSLKDNKRRNVSRITSNNIKNEFIFSNFIVGPNNSLAHAASLAVAENPGILYNPLFIYGHSGLGKTHLLHAIANEIKKRNSSCKLLYQSSEKFINDFINAIRFNQINIFEKKYKNLDLLLIDDIQFISKKEQTQEAFFHIFNTMYESKKQVVFSSDCLPNDIVGLADRLKSRLSAGLIVDIQIPSIETKVAIIKKKSELTNEIIPDNVALFIAENSSSNIRELEGMLIRIIAYSNLSQEPISIELAKRLFFKDSENKKHFCDSINLNADYIAQKVALYFKFSLSDLKSQKRDKNLAFARHIAMYLIKKITKKSLKEISEFFKRRDHTTVIYAISKIEEKIKNNDKFKFEVLSIENNIKKLNLK